ncbi:hypothetical protein VCHA55O508_350012 [Vibrio chagasii]|nr:hypothetical protein VCHA55O508_350012 [Vibrio chagasii]
MPVKTMQAIGKLGENDDETLTTQGAHHVTFPFFANSQH